MTQPDREHHLANKVQIQSVEVSLKVLASDRGTGPFVNDVVNLGELRTTIAIVDPREVSEALEVLASTFVSAISLGLDSVNLFDKRSERLAAELNDLTERMAAARAAREAATPEATA